MRLLPLFVLAACSHALDSEEHSGKGEAHFDRDRMLGVHLEIDPEDGEALASETRYIFELLSGDCLGAPFANIFNWYPAAVTVDGVRLEDVGVRKKGLIGSLSTDKPGLKIKTDKFVDDQVLPEGTERLTLNNSVSDPSIVRQCLGYDLFAAAGVPAPRCNFAHVTTPDGDLGVYVHVEAIKKDFLRQNFASASGDLYEGALSDFHDEWMRTFEAKTDDTDEDFGPLKDLKSALESPDDTLVEAVSQRVDLPSFYRFWAMETLVGHTDGYVSNANNYYLYRDPETDLLVFIPWGIDYIFRDSSQLGGEAALQATAELPRRLLGTQEGRDGYSAAVRELLDTVWDEAAILASIEGMEATIEDTVLDSDTVHGDINQLRDFVNGRRARVLGELESGALLDQADPRDPPCLQSVGAVDVEIEAPWQTLEQPSWATGDSTVHLSLGDESIDGTGGAVAGGEGERVVLAAAIELDGEWLEVRVGFAESDFVPGTVALDLRQNLGVLSTIPVDDPDTASTVAVLDEASVVLTEVSWAAGDIVQARIEGEVMALPW